MQLQVLPDRYQHLQKPLKVQKHKRYYCSSIGPNSGVTSIRIPIGQRVLPLLAVLLVVAPGTRSGVFDGFPLSGAGEFVLIAIASILFASRTKAHEPTQKSRSHPSIQAVVLIVLLLALVIKLSLYWWQPSTGEFESCHRHLDSASAEDSCLPSFDNTPGVPSRSEHFDRHSATVSAIDFGSMSVERNGISSSNWALGFVNSRSYDDGYFPWEPDDLNIEYFPFAVEIAGAVSGKTYETVSIDYVGEGILQFGDMTFRLNPSYETGSTFTIDLPPETEVMRIDFNFAQKVKNSSDQKGPYATLRVTDGNGNPVRADEPTSFRTMRLIPDFIIVLVLGAWIWSLRRRLFTASVLAPIGLAGLAVFADDVTSIGSKMPIGLSSLVLGVIVVGYLFGKRIDLLGVLTSGLIVSYHLVRTEFEFVAKHLVPLDYVFPRLRGNDHLVYQAFTQEMLDSGFLRGAESVFYFQPGIRYIYYVGHWLFGSGDVIPGLVILFGIFASIVFLVHAIRESATQWLKLIALGAFGLIIWWSSSHTVQTTIFGLSESGTWPLLIILAGMYIRRHISTASMISVGVMLGAIVWIRPNQGIASLAWLLCFMAMARHISGRSRDAMICVGSFVSMLILVPIHNVIFGDTLSFLPGGRMFTEHYGWTTIFKVFNDDAARRFIIEQVKGVLYLPTVLPDLYSRQLALAFALFAFTYAMGIVKFFGMQSVRIREGLMLQLVVLGQIAPFLSYSVYRYFPVHIIAIHLSIVLVGMLLLSGSGNPHRAGIEEDLQEFRTLVP